MVVIQIRRSSLRAALVGVVFAVAAFGVSNALANHDGGTIHACASNSNGSLRLVNSASECRSNETAVEWLKEGAVPVPQACSSGQFVTGISAAGEIMCASASTSGGTGGGNSGGGDTGGDVCGDGVRTGFEACDDGNTITETACPYGQASCTRCNSSCSEVVSLTGPVCGDGKIDPPEECDDGNTVETDGCSASCTLQPPS